MSGIVERLTCKVTKEVKDGIVDVGQGISLKKGSLALACRALMERAFAEPGEPGVVLRVFEGVETESCTFDAPEELSLKLNEYQRFHRFSERRKAYKSALLRGYALHLADSGTPPA
jgi:hypothetical protein